MGCGRGRFRWMRIEIEGQDDEVQQRCLRRGQNSRAEGRGLKQLSLNWASGTNLIAARLSLPYLTVCGGWREGDRGRKYKKKMMRDIEILWVHLVR